MNGAVDLTGYHLSFDAEMTSSADMAYFSTSFNNGDRTIPYNSEAEWYAPYDPSSPSNPYTFQNGELTITASPTPAYGLPYTSGLLNTGQSFYQNQGYFEIRAETPSGAGFWPAFWMLAGGPTDYTTELDILEQPNNDGTNNFYDAVKTPTFNVGAFNNTGLDLSAGYHSYGFMWTANSIQFTFDGQYIGYANATPPALATLKMYLLANLAVGGYGSWPGTPVAGTSAQYKIDYIRAYSNDPSVPVWYGHEAVSTPVPPFQPTITVGSGPDVLALQIAEDAYNGDAQYTVSVDGTQVGGVQTATAIRGAGATQALDVLGSFGAGKHTVTVNFLNDAWGGSNATDRNLYVTQASIDNTAVPASSLAEYIGGPQSFTFQGAATPVDTLTLGVSEDAWNGDAQYTVSVDGKQAGGVYTATASHAAGKVGQQVITGSWGNGPHTVGITFINDAWGGSAATDRNLYVNAVNYDGAAVAMSTVAEYSNGAASIATPAVPLPPGAPLPDTLTLGVSEDAWQGDAQYTVTIDGQQAGGVYTATASHAAGLITQQMITGSFGKGPHTIGITFINDLWGGTPTTDRNLFVNTATFDGAAVAMSTIALLNNGTATVMTPAAANPGILTLHMAEDAYQGDAQFTVAIDGKQTGGTQTVTAPNTIGVSQAFSFAANLSAGSHDVSISFLNALPNAGGSSPTGRNLYVAGADLNGTGLSASVWGGTLTTNSTDHFNLIVPS